MLTQEEMKRLRHVEAQAIEFQGHNTWGVGGEDIMLVFKWADELGVQFSMKNFGPSDTVYVDLSIENALTFAESLIAAIRGAMLIDREYAESQTNE